MSYYLILCEGHKKRIRHKLCPLSFRAASSPIDIVTLAAEEIKKPLTKKDDKVENAARAGEEEVGEKESATLIAGYYLS